MSTLYHLSRARAERRFQAYARVNHWLVDRECPESEWLDMRPVQQATARLAWIFGLSAVVAFACLALA